MRLLLLLSFTLLAACGQAGDLYLPPEQPAEPAAAQPAAETPPAEQDKKEEPPKEQE
jgi:predicted small lipoprotein YifL